MVRLDIFSDPICPWCYIGKANLDRALESRPDHPFVIEWHPFQLNPDIPPEGMDRRDYLTLKFGNPHDAVQAYLPVLETAEAAGLSLDLGAITRTPNTLNAHRLIHWAGLEGRQNAVVAALFRAYFQQGRDIGDAAVLTELAGAAGMDATIAARLLDSDADRDALLERDRHARARGIQGVPCFIVADTHVVTGAQPVTLWQNVIDDLTRKDA